MFLVMIWLMIPLDHTVSAQSSLLLARSTATSRPSGTVAHSCETRSYDTRKYAQPPGDAP